MVVPDRRRALGAAGPGHAVLSAGLAGTGPLADAARSRQVERAAAGRTRRVDDTPVRQALRGARLWILSGIYACYGMSFFGFVFWLPTIIKSSGVADPLSIGLISAIPGRGHCRDVGRRRLCRPPPEHAAGANGAVRGRGGGLGCQPRVADSVSASMAVLSIAMFGLMASLPVFWNLPTAAYQGASAAVAIAVITSVGNAPGLVSPYIVGWIKTLTSRLDVAMYMFAAASLLAVALLACLSERPAPDAEYHAPPGDAACPPSISCPNCAACSAAMPSCRARRSSNTAMPTGAACRRGAAGAAAPRDTPGIGRAGHLQQTRPARSDAGRVDGPCGRRLHHGRRHRAEPGAHGRHRGNRPAVGHHDGAGRRAAETVQQAAARAGLLFPLDLARAAVARWAAISRPTQAATA